MESLINNDGSYWIIGIGVVGFITRSVLKLILDRNLETHKIDLQKASIEHQTIFSKLYMDRGEIIRVIYIKIIKVERSLNDLVGYPTKEYSGNAKEKIIDLKHFFEENRIYFQELFASDLEKLIITAYNAFYDASWNSEHKIEDITDVKIKEETLSRRLNGLEMVRHELPETKKLLEREFRMLLGVN